MIAQTGECPSSAPPVWLLDVDGVLNGTGRAGWHSQPMRRTMRTSDGDLTIKWAPQAMVAIRELHQTGAVDIRWATSWLDSPGDLRDLEVMLGLPSFEPAYEIDPDRLRAPDLKSRHAAAKLNAALGVVAGGRCLIWTDDDAIPSIGDPRRDVFEAEGDRTLLIAPKPQRGLRPEHLTAITKFIGRAALLD